MFPTEFEASVYTVQPTVRPTDTIANPVNPFGLQPSPPVDVNSRRPAQDCNVTGPQPHPGAPTDAQPPATNLQLAAKRRRKTEASFYCTFPNCSADFTTQHRLDSHLKGIHYGIKDNICGRCPYATAHPSDLQRHVKSRHPES